MDQATSTKPKDKVFTEQNSGNHNFEFNAKVVAVFDDMVTRSVPFYLEMQRMMAELANDLVPHGGKVYDLGCSTGNTLISLDSQLDSSIALIGIDSSKEMVRQCQANLQEVAQRRPLTVVEGDIAKGVDLEGASLVVLCLTMQFIRPIHRERMMKSIFSQLAPGGAVILIEKVLGESSLFNRLFIDYYYNFKRRNDYSDMEISQKREALENVLVPYTLEENLELLQKVGFSTIEVFFKWYNFTGLIAKKTDAANG